jgi:HD-GYP domain-containing protein (c-di-GMP phosphodiesterase class II)
MLCEHDQLNLVMKLGVELTEVKDVDVLLERILFEARKLVSADAGSIYIKEGDKLKFSYTQNDTQEKKLPPGRKLIYSTFSIPINNQTISGYVANTSESLNISDCYQLACGLPYSFNRSYDDLSGYRTQSMLTFPLRTTQGGTIGVLQLINAKDPVGKVVPFSKEDEPLVLHFANMAAVAIERAQMTRALILRTIKMAELRDPKETGAHVNRVAAYSVAIYEAWARRRGIPPETLDKDRDILRMAAMLHDVGKVAISDAILKKPGRLDDEERRAMQQHSVMGARLFIDRYSEFDEAAALVALNHHERWDGKGYPGFVNPLDGKALPGYENSDGTPRLKKGEEIPVFGRVVAIADVFDALGSKRAYKESWDEGKVLEELTACSGTQFDPEMVETLISNIDSIRSLGERYKEL